MLFLKCPVRPNPLLHSPVVECEDSLALKIAVYKSSLIHSLDSDQPPLAPSHVILEVSLVVQIHPGALSIDQLALAMSLVCVETAFIDSLVWPSVSSLAVHLVFCPLSIVDASILELIDASSVPLAVFVVAFVLIVFVKVDPNSLLLSPDVIGFAVGIGFVLESLQALNQRVIFYCFKHIVVDRGGDVLGGGG